MKPASSGYLSPLPEFLDFRPAPLDIEKLRADIAARRTEIEKNRRGLEPLLAKRNKLRTDADSKQSAANASAEFRQQTDDQLLQKYHFSEEQLQAKKTASREDLRASQAANDAGQQFEAEHAYLDGQVRAIDEDEAALELAEFLLEARIREYDLLLSAAETAARQARLNELRGHPLAKHLPEILGFPDGVFCPVPGDPRRPSASTIYGAARLRAEEKFRGILRADDPVRELASHIADLDPRMIAWLG